MHWCIWLITEGIFSIFIIPLSVQHCFDCYSVLHINKFTQHSSCGFWGKRDWQRFEDSLFQVLLKICDVSDYFKLGARLGDKWGMTLPQFFVGNDPSFVGLNDTDLTESPLIVLVSVLWHFLEICSDLVAEMFLLICLIHTAAPNSATVPQV